MSYETRKHPSPLGGDDCLDAGARVHGAVAEGLASGEGRQAAPHADKIAIRVENLSKCYQIYDTSRDRLKQFVVPRLQRLRGQAPKQYYRDFWALKDVSFDIKKGETVGIIGRNGCGKSTLLQIICGTLTPTSGSVETSGRIAALLELGSGFNPEFTGRENVYMNAAVLGMSKDEVANRFDGIAAFADIGEFIEQPVKNYSSGMVVRLAFAVAIHVDPDILVVDEALSVGDIRFQNKCLRKIGEVREKGCSILFVSHSPNQVEALCGRVVWLNDGCIKGIGAPAQLVRSYVNFMVHGLNEQVAEARPMPIGNGENLSDDEATNAHTGWCWSDLGGSHNIQRSGGADIKRVRIRFADEDGAVQTICEPQLVQLETEIEFQEEVNKPLIGIGVFNSLNEPVVHFNSANLKLSFAPIDGACRARVKVNFTLPALRPGEYLVALGIDDGVPGASKILCHVYDAWTFRVVPSGRFDGQGGYIQIADAELKLSIREVESA